MKITSPKGFTLIELLITLALIAITTGLIIQNLHHVQSQTTNDILSSKIIKTINFAKQESLLRHTDIQICFTNPKDQCQSTPTENLLTLTTQNQTLKTTRLHLQSGHLFWRAYPSYQDRIIFHASGDKLSDNATYWYCSRDQHSPAWAITLSRDGRVNKILPNSQGVIRDGHGKLLAC